MARLHDKPIGPNVILTVLPFLLLIVAMRQRVLSSLRCYVERLEENDLFEQTILRGSLITEKQPPSSGDIDTIMQSMMNLSSEPTSPRPVVASAFDPDLDNNHTTTAEHPFDVPTRAPFTSTPVFQGLGFDMSRLTDTGSVLPGRRSSRIKARTRRV